MLRLYETPPAEIIKTTIVPFANLLNIHDVVIKERLAESKGNVENIYQTCTDLTDKYPAELEFLKHLMFPSSCEVRKSE